METEFLFYLAIFFTSILYSSVGHGGASGYLAIMALFAIDPIYMRASALTLNMFVAGISFFHFYRGGHFRLKLLLPFIALSIPMSFIGARLDVNPYTYKIILGIFLLIAVIRMLFFTKSEKEAKPIYLPLALVFGAVLGFFSGMIGIGGGIILSPLLLLMGWATIKETAAISAIFIFLNSASGILGVIAKGFEPISSIYILIVLGIIGSIIGSQLGQKRLTPRYLMYMLSFVLLFASFKLFYFA
ncbi:sulfite exporter TauE/SafE family protein [Carboxylicivirga sediminis]|uniref:Probable membrane transporter protein n=1 Tax=Carboxylicivirga sediminis TaxID=2006564 RepID=A0A941F2U5_9BACT|nr:sulfite exporter TauE/SafE family protein [Carboxylicivirga sediminis]MBR8535322.1 sulfite exporter TauE/SafE family protein [Carboxylicivirga sediminis]